VLPIEEVAGRESELGVAAPDVRGPVPVACPVDAQVPEEPGRDWAVLRGRLDVERASVAQVEAPVVAELVALGVAPEVVVVVEHQHAAVGAADLPSEEVGGGQAADAAADHHQVVRLAGVARGVVCLAADEPVRDFPRAVVAPPHAGSGRRVEPLLARRGVGSRSEQGGEPVRRSEWKQRPGQRDADTAHEVSAGDRTAHAEVAIRGRGHGVSPFGRQFGTLTLSSSKKFCTRISWIGSSSPSLPNWFARAIRKP
jgi:hypothetical protein